MPTEEPDGSERLRLCPHLRPARGPKSRCFTISSHALTRELHTRVGRWDWGPAFVSAGLSGFVSLTVTNEGRLLPDVAVAQDWSGNGSKELHDDVGVVVDGVTLYVTVFLDGFERDYDAENITLGAVRFTLWDTTERLEGETVAESCAAVTVVAPEGTGNSAGGVEGIRLSAEEIFPVSANLSVTDPHLWWPKGLGPQPLYTLRVDWYPGTLGSCPPHQNDDPYSSDAVPVAPRSTETRRIGLRQVSLMREPRSFRSVGGMGRGREIRAGQRQESRRSVSGEDETIEGVGADDGGESRTHTRMYGH